MVDCTLFTLLCRRNAPCCPGRGHPRWSRRLGGQEGLHSGCWHTKEQGCSTLLTPHTPPPQSPAVLTHAHILHTIYLYSYTHFQTHYIEGGTSIYRMSYSFQWIRISSFYDTFMNLYKTHNTRISFTFYIMMNKIMWAVGDLILDQHSHSETRCGYKTRNDNPGQTSSLPVSLCTGVEHCGQVSCPFEGDI